MSNSTFKLTLIAASLLAAQTASAAIYNVVEVTPSTTENQYYGSAIESKEITDTTSKGCFESDASCADYVLAGDTRNGTEGISYSDEVPFNYDNRFTILDKADLENYCYDQLGYNTCDVWADDQWYGGDGDTDGGLERERDAFYNKNYKSNATAFDSTGSVSIPTQSSYHPGNGNFIPDTQNAVITNLDVTNPIGIASSGYYNVGGNYALAFRQRGFYDSTFLTPPASLPLDTSSNQIVTKMGRTFAYGSFSYTDNSGDTKTYVVGSSAVAPFDNGDDDKNYYGDLSRCTSESDPAAIADCQNFAFATKAALWDVTDLTDPTKPTKPDELQVTNTVANWKEAKDANSDDDYAAQASARSGAVSAITKYQGKPVLAGFDTWKDDNRYYMQAAIFYPNSDFDNTGVSDNAWIPVFIKNTKIDDGDDYIYSNSLVKAINRNLIAIGETKRFGNYPENGAANNRLFYVDAATGSASTEPSAVYLSGDIFFKGAGGEANAINNFNEVVGSIDAEKDREVDGKSRRRRGFIDPLNLTNSNDDRMKIFDNKAWWLDNLTNDGIQSGVNNQYRIINATGINDDGVISATAYKCDGGYDNLTHNSYCQNGKSGAESLVAVKLVPIPGATSKDITTRGGEKTDTKRAGSLGVWALMLLGFIGFRRKSSIKR
ncbi:DUF3466 family protein [Vibrio algicola]|uniref:DUF3466 family protein n=1 Tax=Vibrio algicola TaxID=2662262 RepID=A0A5Q0TFQ6_9VIBR|nr:DUF3466 family protein [Vibrio algicola]